MQVIKSSYRIRINGIVQGVGFRPYAFRLACELGLDGWVLNSSYGVLIEVEGGAEDLDEFVQRIIVSPPPLARIREYNVEKIDPAGYRGFVIRESQKEQNRNVMISPDIATCSECRKEILNPDNRRYQYHFTNCTNCGPRFTIIQDIPYDRSKTTMASFPMCPLCQSEYEDPSNRRFHAQPNACPVCGPRITLLDQQGKESPEAVTALLKAGFIIAV